MSPQLATVATMLLVAVFVLTNTVSADGSISGMYSASIKLAEQSGANGKGVNGSGFSQGVKKFFVGGNDNSSSEQPAQPQSNEGQNGADKGKTGAQKSESPAGQKTDNSPRGASPGKR